MSELSEKEKRIRHLLISLKMTQEEAAAFLGYSRAYFSKLINTSNIEKQLDDIITKLENKYSKQNTLVIEAEAVEAASGSLGDEVLYRSKGGMSIRFRYSAQSDETYVSLDGGDGTYKVRLTLEDRKGTVDFLWSEFSVAIPGNVSKPKKIELIAEDR